MKLSSSVIGSSFSPMNHSLFFFSLFKALLWQAVFGQPGLMEQSMKATIHCLFSHINDTAIIGFLLTSSRQSIWKNHYELLVTVTCLLHT